MTTQNDQKPSLINVCANCGSPGLTSELPDGKTFFCCYICGGSKMTTVEITDNINNLSMEENHD